jgi:chlorite dismutase
MPQPLLVTFAAGAVGAWRIDQITAVIGGGLPAAERLEVLEGTAEPLPKESAWVLRGVTSNARYTNRAELDALAARQEGLARRDATRAALIPIRKNEAWWTLAQNERRAVFEERSRHIGVGLEYLPAVARRLHHSRELGEPFDFLTWFEYAPEYARSFEELVRRLRETEEWCYVDREIDIRLSRV